MTTRTTQSRPDDNDRLKRSLRDALSRLPDDGLHALEVGAMAPWHQRTPTAQTAVLCGPLATLRAGWRGHPMVWSGALKALVLMALLWLKPLADIDELSLNTLGEL